MMETRIPKQDRSRASVERMVGAAEQLMRERGTDGFTLAEICKLASVSMGGIYYRFSSKDDLLRLVHSRLMNDLARESSAAISRAVEQGTEIPALLQGLVGALGETLRHFAPMLRPLMLRSISDPVIRLAGKDSYQHMENEFVAAILSRRPELLHPDAETAARTSYTVTYAALGRSLGLNSSAGYVVDIIDWHALKQDLAVMCAAFLLSDKDFVRRAKSG